jgi:drug/metabolite transporter (DMT)-like permease
MSQANNQARMLATAAAFVLLWNSGFIGAAWGLPYAGTFTLLFWRYLVLALVLGAVLAWRRRLIWPGLASLGHAAVVGVLAHGAWLACALLSLERGVPAGIVALVVALQPLATGALSGLVTGESTSARQWAGLALGFVGVAVAVGTRIEWSDAGSAFAYLVPLGSVIAITIASLLQRRREVLGRRDLPLGSALFYQCAATALVLVVPAMLIEGLATRWTPEFLATMAWLIFAVSLGAYALMWRLLEDLDAARVASLFYLGPPVTMLMGWLAFGDRLQPTDLAGMLIAMLGVTLVYQGRGRRRSTP